MAYHNTVIHRVYDNVVSFWGMNAEVLAGKGKVCVHVLRIDSFQPTPTAVAEGQPYTETKLPSLAGVSIEGSSGNCGPGGKPDNASVEEF